MHFYHSVYFLYVLNYTYFKNNVVHIVSDRLLAWDFASGITPAT